MKVAVEAVRKNVEELKAKVAEAWKSSKDVRADAALRGLRKKLKRSQRKLAHIAPAPTETRHKAGQKHLDNITSLLSKLQQTKKKGSGDANVRSLRKKSKSAAKLVKRLNKILEKRKKAEAPKAEAAAAPAEPAKA